MRKWRHPVFAGMVGVLLLATACGSEDTDASTVAATPSANGESFPGISVPEAAGSAGASAGVVTVRTDPELGPVVTDGDGRTLYRFDKDTADPAKSNCDGKCAQVWPPVLAEDATASKELNSDLLGSVTRTDGSEQLTLGGWPMYYFAEDTEAGDVKGQGVAGTWAASTPDGKKAGATRPTLGVLNSPALGKVLTDQSGKTLYLFTKDTPWPMKTACDEACLKKWTPAGLVKVSDAEALGLDPKSLFTFTRPDGTKQEAFNCWPAYTFNGDTAPGQTNGQGVGGVWFAIKSDVANDQGKTIPAAKGESGDSGSTASAAPDVEESPSTDSDSPSEDFVPPSTVPSGS